MCKIGYFDDDMREYESYKCDFARYKIELIKVDGILSKHQLRDYILNEKLDAMIIDYKLSKFRNKELLNGNELVRYLDNEIPDFPSIIITSYVKNSQEQNTVINSLILDRDIMTKDTDGKEYGDFINKILNLISVFRKRLQLNCDEYKKLLSKRQNKHLMTPYEEHRMLNLYEILYSYGLIDEINSMILTPTLSVKLDKVLEDLKKIVDKK